ncbi:MAG: DUF465 domain-containing protein [Pseudomonadota bacterium]
MNIDARITSLGQRHKDLDIRLLEELQRPHPDDTRISDLKRRKLAMKDEMMALKAQRHPH